MTQFEQLYHVMKKPWVIGISIIALILLYCFVDRPVAIYFHQLDLRTHLPVLSLLTAFGKWKIYVALFILAGLYFRFIRKNQQDEIRAWYLLGCVLIPNILGFIIKVIVSRARPDLLFASDSFGFYWFQTKDLYWSFPSGHSLTVVGLASGLGVLLPRYFYAFLAFAFLIVLSRVVLFHHYLSDVMTGAYLSILLVGCFTEFLQKRHYLK